MMGVQSYDGNFYWLHTDHLGNGRKLTNSSGTVVYRAEFDPHGQILYEWQSSGQTYLNSHKFTGYERDWATNLNYAKARTYNHNRARFLQPDPLGLRAADLTNPLSLNLYSYVHNDPMNFVDPDGMNARMCFGYNVSISEDGGETWRIIGFIPVFCWDVGGSGGGGGGQQAGAYLDDGKVIKDAVTDTLKVLDRIKDCGKTIKGGGKDSQDNPRALLKGLYDSGMVVADRTITGEVGKTSFGDGLKGKPISLGEKFFSTSGGTFSSFNSGSAYEYSVTLNPNQFRVLAVIHELSHKTGRFAYDPNSKDQDFINKKLVENCIKPAIKAGII